LDVSAAEVLTAPANDEDSGDVLTVSEAAAYLRINVKSLYKLIDEQKIPHVRITERRIRLYRPALVAWLSGKEQAPRRKKP
jgi:excisionase family DNA binding protein